MDGDYDDLGDNDCNNDHDSDDFGYNDVNGDDDDVDNDGDNEDDNEAVVRPGGSRERRNQWT